jgi:hypothetical protein
MPCASTSRRAYPCWLWAAARSVARSFWLASAELTDDEDDDGPDYDWSEVPGALAGDTDIELLWSPELDGIGDPNDHTNADLGMGDYRAESWHHRFDQYVGDEEYPSALS